MSRYIDADKLQTRMLNYYSDSWRLCEEINDFFANIPTADVRENVRGHWIEIQEPMRLIFECSNCSELSDYRTNFCPNCGSYNGAKMEVKE